MITPDIARNYWSWFRDPADLMEQQARTAEEQEDHLLAAAYRQDARELRRQRPVHR